MANHTAFHVDSGAWTHLPTHAHVGMHVDPQDTLNHGDACTQKGTWVCNSPAQKAKTSLWIFLAQLWRWEAGRSCNVRWKGYSGRSYQILFLPGWETFPHTSYISTRGLEKQSLCNVQWCTHRNLIYSLCSCSYVSKLFFNLKKRLF